MAVLNGNDIVFTYSGGSGNKNPALCLGGDPSAFPILGLSNNLFDDVTNAEAQDGNIDFRCFYIFNDSVDASLVNASIYVESEVDLGAVVQLGIHTAIDAQKIKISQPVNSGTFTIAYQGIDAVVAYDPDLAVWGLNLQNALNGLDELSGVEVSVSVVVEDAITYSVFNILFKGDDKNKYHPVVELTDNSLDTAPDIVISKEINGGPINEIAPEIAVDTVSPVDVTFQASSLGTAIFIGKIGPGDGVPIWTRRTTAPGTQPLENDGYSVTLIGDAF